MFEGEYASLEAFYNANIVRVPKPIKVNLNSFNSGRVATVREKYLENENFSKSGKSQGNLWMAREI